MFHLLGSLGEFYSDNLSKETHKGKYERARQGYHNGWVPWGYKSEEVENRMLSTALAPAASACSTMRPMASSRESCSSSV